MPDAAPSPLARALGRVPCGLYVVTTQEGGAPVGFVGSFVMQVGFEPPTVCVAVGKERGPLGPLRARGQFTLSVLDGASRGVMATFFKKRPQGGSPYDELELASAPSGVPVLAGALAWLDCAVVGEHETGDHVVLFGRVEAGSLAREGDPSVHLRKDGLGY